MVVVVVVVCIVIFIAVVLRLDVVVIVGPKKHFKNLTKLLLFSQKWLSNS